MSCVCDVDRGAPEPGGAGGVCLLHPGRTVQVPGPLPAGRLPAARLRRSPHAFPRRRRSRAGAVLPDPGGAAAQPGEQQEDRDPVSVALVFVRSRLTLTPGSREREREWSKTPPK